MSSDPDENYVLTYIESLKTERGFSAHTCRAYQHDLEEFMAYLNSGRNEGDAAPMHPVADWHLIARIGGGQSNMH